MPDKPLIFDIGANTGSFTSRYVNQCRIIAVEPNSELIPSLTNTLLNHDGAIETSAVSNKDGETDFFVCSYSQMSSCNKDWLTKLRYANVGYQEVKKVPTITFDTLIARYGKPFHTKIDVEGYEFEVVEGLSQKVGTIQFEYLNERFQQMAIPIICKLYSLGYTKFATKELSGDFDPFETEPSALSVNDIIIRQNRYDNTGGMILAF